MLNIIRKHPMLFFILLTFLISWLPWYSGGQGIFVFGPTLAGLLTTVLIAGKEGLQEITLRAIRWRVGWKWWLIALFLPALLTLAAIYINVLLGGSIPSFTFIKQGWYLLPVFFVITLVGGPLGEEFGWRGFALPRLQEKWNPILASVIIGSIWGLWHLPQFFNPSAIHYELGLTYFPLYILAEIGLATLMTWVYNKTKGSLLVGGFIYHNADNFWGTVLLTQATMSTALSGSDPAHVDLRLWIISTLVGFMAALLVAVITKGNLGFEKNKG
ncbi:MAG: CPBP family intramembrane metalloprotease [Chloroflexi bacterium]|nr:CPBP family intramembrane metalloprotease [Chloroflexota bacterium]